MDTLSLLFSMIATLIFAGFRHFIFFRLIAAAFFRIYDYRRLLIAADAAALTRDAPSRHAAAFYCLRQRDARADIAAFAICAQHGVRARFARDAIERYAMLAFIRHLPRA